MTKVRSRGEQIRRFIVSHVEKHPTDIARFAAQHFGITRQAINKHLRLLVEERVLVSDGKTRNCVYRLYPLIEGRCNHEQRI
jgi:predicted transcriptional regulator